MKKIYQSLGLGTALWVFAVFLTFAHAQQGAPGSPQDQSVSGVINSITEDRVVITTDQGNTSSFMLDKGELPTASDLQAGDRVLLSVNESNEVTSIQKMGEHPGGTLPEAPGAGDGMSPGAPPSPESAP
jgi:hypothetical protein